MNIDKRLLRQARKSKYKLLLTIGLGFAAGILTVLQADYLSRSATSCLRVATSILSSRLQKSRQYQFKLPS